VINWQFLNDNFFDIKRQNYHVTFPKSAADGESNFAKVMLMESDRFQNINYTLADFKTEAGAIQGEYNYRVEGT